jgi:hypothetical protein
MKKFLVRYEQITYFDIPVEAVDEEEARLKSLALLPTATPDQGGIEFNCVEDA